MRWILTQPLKVVATENHYAAMDFLIGWIFPAPWKGPQ